MSNWYVYQGDGRQREQTPELPQAPTWRRLEKADRDVVEKQEGNRTMRRHVLQVTEDERILVNAAIYLRRPLLVTGLPGTGKSSLARAIAYELNLSNVLQWSITSRATIGPALYSYDAIGRLQAASLARRNIDHDLARLLESSEEDESSTSSSVLEQYKEPPIQDYLRLGPLGTALATSTAEKPRVLLIDEFDKGDIDLPNDLLNIFERGEFPIPELARLKQREIKIRPSDSEEAIVKVTRGQVYCQAFPIVVITSNGEREFPAPFMRRCLQLKLELPDEARLKQIIHAHFEDLTGFSSEEKQKVDQLIAAVLDFRSKGKYVSADQLLNAVHLVQTAERQGPISIDEYKEHVLTEIGGVSDFD